MIHRATALIVVTLLSAVIAPWYVASWDLTFVKAGLGDPKLAKAQLWLFLVAVQAAAWVVSGALVIGAFRNVWHRHLGAKRRSALAAAGQTLLLIGALYLYQKNAGSAGRPDRLGDIELNHVFSFAQIGLMIAACAVAGMFFVRFAVLAQDKESQADVSAYIFFKVQLHVFLYSAALILSLGTLGTAALRAAVNAERGPNHFPAEYVLIYGGIFTLLLLIAYVPVKAALWHLGHSVTDQTMQAMPDPAMERVKWLEEKGKLEKALDLDLTSVSALVGPVAAILPLLAGWISLLLGRD